MSSYPWDALERVLADLKVPSARVLSRQILSCLSEDGWRLMQDSQPSRLRVIDRASPRPGEGRDP